MSISSAQKAEIEAIIKAILDVTNSRRRRQLAEMFLDLVDRESWPEYYQIIPNPRSINGVRENLARNKYKDPLQAYQDLSLVFYNALFYNEDGSQIAKDAATLKQVLDKEWRGRSLLPTPPEGLPATSAQAVHGVPPSSSPTTASHQPTPGAPSSPTKSKQTQVSSTTPAGQPNTPSPKRAAPTATATTSSLQSAQTPGRPQRQSQRQAQARAEAVKSPEQHMSPDMDVDVGGTPELDSTAQEMALDSESDAIVQQLEKGLPRWEGFSELGWNADIPPSRFIDIVNAIKDYTDDSGNKLVASLETIPEDANIPDIPYKEPLSLNLIESRVRSGYFETSVAFDKEILKLFLKARRWYEPASEAYTNVLLLQRLYQALTSSDPPPGPPYRSSTNFAALPAGPGTARPLHSTDAEGVPGVTTFRVSAKDRHFVDEVHYKGWSFRLADWVHLANCDDAGRPIVAQVFRCYISEEPSKRGQPGITVCWYFRPEQTYHPMQRQFWEREVFKTSHFADHPLEDVIEKLACQFTARHIRGRPRPPYWYPGWPLYVCDSRYNDRERIFVKIKNWNSCVPEEVRKSAEFMPIYPFEKPVFPRRFASPFISGRSIKGPGGIGDVIERGEGEKIEGGGIGRKRTRKGVSGSNATLSRSEWTDRLGQSKGVYVGPPLPGVTTAAATATPSAVTTPMTAYPQYQAPQPALAGRAPSVQPGTVNDRSIIAAAGGAAALGGNAIAEKLPPETTKHFDRDPETNEMLWFAAPPVDIVHTPAPQYSLEYLHFLARKRKAARESMDVDAPRKQRRAQPTMTERIGAILAEATLPQAAPATPGSPYSLPSSD